MFTGVDTIVVLAAGVLFTTIAFFTSKDDGSYWLYCLGIGLPIFWFVAGFHSWKKFIK